jgi:formylmethanofuran dehydrogenase subunit E
MTCNRCKGSIGLRVPNFKMFDLDSIRAAYHENNKETEPADKCPVCDSMDISPSNGDLSGGKMFCNACGETW